MCGFFFFLRRKKFKEHLQRHKHDDGDGEVLAEVNSDAIGRENGALTDEQALKQPIFRIRSIDFSAGAPQRRAEIQNKGNGGIEENRRLRRERRAELYLVDLSHRDARDEQKKILAG